jgi:catechol 2,3-dioxygenase-like lactoylglutathione lyase family enzyme
MSIRNLRHIGIVVRDIRSAVGFYAGILGFTIASQEIESGPYLDAMLDLPGAEACIVKLQGPGCGIELIAFTSHMRQPQPKDICDCGITHIALTVEDAEKMHTHLTTYGVKCLSAPQLTDGGFLVFFARDTEGNFLEFVQALN